MNPSLKKNQDRQQAAARTLADVGERAWLRQVRQWFAEDGQGLKLAIGDDCAAVDVAQLTGPLLVTTDTLIEGVHFRREWISPRDLGARALAVNLSDLAAMGAQPLAAFLALSVPPETALEELKAFFLGLREECRAFACPLAGGDLTRAPQWTIAMTVLGRPAVGGRIARRSSVRPGQLLYVTGWPGESGAGLVALERGLDTDPLIHRHVRPTPRLPEASVLSRICPDLAMIDVSDGVWNDADQLAEASGVRLELEAEALPTSPPMEELARLLGVEPHLWTLFGGEDYELLFSTVASLEMLQAAFAKAGLMTPLHCIGRVALGRGVHLMDCDGGEIEMEDRTFHHF